jgi:ABC-type transport system substrate-binding protein
MIAYFQDAWKAVGIEIQPKSLEFSALIEATTTNLDWAMAWYNFSWDATFIQDAMFGCDQYQVGFNDMKYCNPELDEIFAATKREFDAEKRRDLLIQAANIVNDEQPVGIVYFDVGISAWNDRVHNVHPSAWGNQSYVGIWIDE